MNLMAKEIDLLESYGILGRVWYIMVLKEPDIRDPNIVGHIRMIHG